MAREVITTRAHGIDISHWQGTYNYHQTWGQVDFVIQKMTEGTWWDQNYGALWDNGTSQVAIRGMYHYQRSGVSWKAQADNILAMVERVTPKIHIIALDVEKINNTLDKTYFSDSKRILEYLSVNSDRRVVLYINPDVFNIAHPLMLKNFGQEGVRWLFDYPMWLAQYWWTPDPNKQPATPALRGDWDIWQYTDKGDSKNAQGWRRYGSPDLNVFNGTVDQMRVWAGVDDAPAPPQPPAAKVTIESVTVKLSNDSEVTLK